MTAIHSPRQSLLERKNGPNNNSTFNVGNTNSNNISRFESSNLMIVPQYNH